MALTRLDPRFGSVNLAHVRLDNLPSLSTDAPHELARAWEFAQAVADELPAPRAVPYVNWGALLASTQIIYAVYQDLPRAAQGSELDALRVAVALLEAGLERDSGVAEADKEGWSILALIGHGMLGQQQAGAFRSPYLPRLQDRHPATLTAAALSASDWQAAASPSAGLLPEPYRSLMEQVILVSYDSPVAEPSRLDPHDASGLYADCLRAVLADNQTFDVCCLGYARQSLYQLLAAHRAQAAARA